MLTSRRGRPSDVTIDDVIFVASCFGAIALIFVVLRCLYEVIQYWNSKTFQGITTTPMLPTWLNEYPLGNLTKINHRHFTIYKKSYLTRMQFPRTNKEKSRKMMKNIRKLLENHFQVPIDSTVIPYSTCIISIPMKNFKCAEVLGEFIALRGGPPGDSFYEYQMIGEDRTQVAYFFAGGVRYVAGVCIYFKDPYQKPSWYWESKIVEMLETPIYWPVWNLKEERMEVLEENNELTLLTRNRYGESKQFQFNGDRREFEEHHEPSQYGYHDFMAQNPDKKLKIEICKFWNTLVMVEEINGKRMHVFWNKKTKKIEYYKCRSCEESEDAEPPSYHECTQFQPLIN